MTKELDKILPILGIEHDCILSRQGDITIAYKVILPELFTLSNEEYEAFHQVWIKAIKVLPKHTVIHKQDWFVEAKYEAKFTTQTSFLSRSSERFFNERPYLDHQCYIMLTKKPVGRKSSTSLFSSLIKRSIVPAQSMNVQAVQDFFDSAGQFERILKESGFMSLHRLSDEDLVSTPTKAGLPEQYCFLLDGENPFIKDIELNGSITVGQQHCQLFTLADMDDLPPLCGSRINYDKYSTDKTKFSIGFTAALGQ